MADLRKAQADFEELFVKKIGNIATETLPQVSTLIAPIRQELSELLAILSVEERNSPEVFAPLVEEINQMITEFTAKGRSRKTRNENNQDDTTPVTPQTAAK